MREVKVRWLLFFPRLTVENVAPMIMETGKRKFMPLPRGRNDNFWDAPSTKCQILKLARNRGGPEDRGDRGQTTLYGVKKPGDGTVLKLFFAIQWCLVFNDCLRHVMKFLSLIFNLIIRPISVELQKKVSEQRHLLVF